MQDALPGEGRLVPVRTPASRQAAPPRFYNTLLHALSALGEGVVVLEGDRFVYANEAFARMVGRSVGALTEDGFSVRALYAPESRDVMEAKLQQRLSGQVRDDHYAGTLVRPDGGRVHVEISVKSIHEAGRSLRFAVLRDVTERRHAQEALEEARQETARSEKLAALGSLVGGVAHEVRTPLVYIQNSAHVLQRRVERLAEGSTTPQQEIATLRACVAQIEEGVERVNRLVRGLHRHARLPTGQFAPERLDEVVADALRLWRDTHPGTGASVETQLDPVPCARVDRAKLQQVVLNLLDNANDAMPAGGRILLKTEPLPGGVRLVLQDEGMGIEHEALARVFDPLYTTKPHGMGLGLDIVRRIVELHRGAIRCDSSPGHGTTFTVTLPLGSDLGDEAPA